jgi:PPOX class probable F420-dependent enzyme
VPSGRTDKIEELPGPIRSLLTSARRAVMTTVNDVGGPHAVPVVFAVMGDEIVSPIDHKPKTGQTLARVKNLNRDDRVTLLLDQWDEDWTKLAWCMVRGHATVDATPPIELMAAINSRYPQYAQDEVHDALIRIRPTKLSWWSWS